MVAGSRPGAAGPPVVGPPAGDPGGDLGGRRARVGRRRRSPSSLPTDATPCRGTDGPAPAGPASLRLSWLSSAIVRRVPVARPAPRPRRRPPRRPPRRPHDGAMRARPVHGPAATARRARPGRQSVPAGDGTGSARVRGPRTRRCGRPSSWSTARARRPRPSSCCTGASAGSARPPCWPTSDSRPPCGGSPPRIWKPTGTTPSWSAPVTRCATTPPACSPRTAGRTAGSSRRRGGFESLARGAACRAHPP
jgi:hypothetical protein